VWTRRRSSFSFSLVSLNMKGRAFSARREERGGGGREESCEKVPGILRLLKFQGTRTVLCHERNISLKVLKIKSGLLYVCYSLQFLWRKQCCESGSPDPSLFLGSGSFHHQAKKVRKTLTSTYCFVTFLWLFNFEEWRTGTVNLPSKCTVISKKTEKINIRHRWKARTEIMIRFSEVSLKWLSVFKEARRKISLYFCL
jgi:hypothetical protein